MSKSNSKSVVEVETAWAPLLASLFFSWRKYADEYPKENRWIALFIN